MNSEFKNSIKSIVSSEKKISFYDVTPKKTLMIARLFAEKLKTSDSILLYGDIGVGKSFFARAVIQSMMINQSVKVEEVPSPTFTIVQSYDGLSPPVWHIDLYRVLDVDEISELDLEDALETGICLIEWPDKMDSLKQKRNISVTFDVAEPNHNMRTVTIEFNGFGWENISDSLMKNFSK